jgi:hypothetical protein
VIQGQKEGIIRREEGRELGEFEGEREAADFDSGLRRIASRVYG